MRAPGTLGLNDCLGAPGMPQAFDDAVQLRPEANAFAPTLSISFENGEDVNLSALDRNHEIWNSGLVVALREGRQRIQP